MNSADEDSCQYTHSRTVNSDMLVVPVLKPRADLHEYVSGQSDMGSTPSPFFELAWHELSEAIPVALKDFPHLSAIALSPDVWKIETDCARLEIERVEDEIRVTRTVPSGMTGQRVYRVACMRPNLPLLLDRAGNLAPPGIVLEELFEWLAEGSNPTP